MKQKEIADSHYEWLNLSIEDKYKDAQISYFEKFPKGTISDFHLMEIEHWKNRLRKYKKTKSLAWFETKFVIEGRKLLEHYQKLELVKINKRLKAISANYTLEYYTNKKNIPNQDLVEETIEYFKKGPGSRAFKALDFLNLLEKQYHFVVNNWDNESIVIAGLKALPLTELQSHILFGFILKWFGGSPVQDFDETHKATKKAIEREFLNYGHKTPEKEFCKANNEQRKDFMKLGIAVTANINYGVNIADVLNEMGGINAQEKKYSSFQELFQDAVLNDAFGYLENKEAFNKLTYILTESRYLYEFNVWLQENKGWDIGEVDDHKKFLTKNTFLDFLRDQKHIKQKRIAEHEKQKLSWQLEIPQETKRNKRSTDNYKTLKEIFIEESAYGNIMVKLIEETLIDSNSYEWTHKSKGYKTKIVALLYHLYYNKYFNCTELPNPEQIKKLAKTGFQVDIGERTIKSKRVNEVRKEFSFIKQFKPAN